MYLDRRGAGAGLAPLMAPTPIGRYPVVKIHKDRPPTFEPVIAEAQPAEGNGFAKSPEVAEGEGVEVANPKPPRGRSTKAQAGSAAGKGSARA